MTTATSNVQASEGLNPGYTPAPDPNSLAAAQAKAGLTTNDNPNGERPSWLPDNFKTPEDFRKSYDDLRSDHTKKSQELAGLKKEGKKEGDEEKNDEEAKKALSAAGIPEADMQKWSEEFWTTGKVSEEAYAKLAAVGITKEIIDDYAHTKSEYVNGQRTALFNAGGGEENVNKMLDWAGKNLKPEEIAEYNKAFDSGNFNSSVMALEHLKTRFENSEGKTPNLVSGGNLPTASAGSVYTSTAQVMQDMSDPRYKMDPAFRQAVEQKIARSKVL